VHVFFLNKESVSSSAATGTVDWDSAQAPERSKLLLTADFAGALGFLGIRLLYGERTVPVLLLYII
jgi:hypothetical protein